MVCVCVCVCVSLRVCVGMLVRWWRGAVVKARAFLHVIGDHWCATLYACKP